MAKVIGRDSVVGIAVEGTRGTAESAADYWVPFESFDFDDAVEYTDNVSAMGNIAEKNDARITKLYSEGSLEGKVFVPSIGAELVALFGASPSSSQIATSGVYTHTYALANNNNHKSLTMFYEDNLQDVKFALGMINTWSLECVTDDFVKRSMSVMGKKSESASSTASITDDVEFIPSQVEFKQASAQSGLDGASAIGITNFQFEVNKNAEPVYVLGSNEPDDIPNKQITVTGSFELFYEATTQRGYVFNNSHRAMRISMTDDTTDLGSGNYASLTFDFNDCVFKEFERNLDNDDIVRQTISFEAVWSIADGELFSAVLVSDETSY